MSTNFYADWDLGQGLTKRLHIGKRSNGGMSTFQGAVFPTLEAWRTFLTHNADDITLIDENGTSYGVAEFFATEVDESTDGSQYQIEWLQAHYGRDSIAANWWSRHGAEYWMDGTRLFTDHEFS